MQKKQVAGVLVGAIPAELPLENAKWAKSGVKDISKIISIGEVLHVRRVESKDKRLWSRSIKNHRFKARFFPWTPRRLRGCDGWGVRLCKVRVQTGRLRLNVSRDLRLNRLFTVLPLKNGFTPATVII